jgi:transcriptional regulator with XRE-family HTH domain
MPPKSDQQANEAFRENLRDLMELESLTKAELSRKTGVPIKTLGRILSGENGASLTMVKRIARGLKRDHLELLGGAEHAIADELERSFVSLLGVEDAKTLYEQLATAKRLGVYDHCTAAIHGIIVTQIRRRRS